MSEVLDVWTLTAVAVVLFFLGTPVVVVLAAWVIASSYFIVDFPLANVGVASSDSIKSFIFLAVPLFVITGDFLTEGGVFAPIVSGLGAFSMRFSDDCSVVNCRNVEGVS